MVVSMETRKIPEKLRQELINLAPNFQCFLKTIWVNFLGSKSMNSDTALTTKT